MMGKILFLGGLGIEVVRLVRKLLKAIRSGDADEAATIAKEAAEKQALYASGRARFKK